MKSVPRLLGKKGQFFMGLLFVFTLIIFGTLYLDLAAKTDDFDDLKLGERQAALLRTAQNGEHILFYTESAARYAYETAVFETAGQWYVVDTAACETYRGVPVVYGQQDCMDYLEDLEHAVKETATKHFNAALNRYLAAYEEQEDISLLYDNYYLSFSDGVVIGKPSQELILPVFSKTSTEVVEQTEIDPYTGAKMLFTQWPVSTEFLNVNSCFGFRDIDYGTRFHPGVDIAATGHVPVLSIGAGTVTTVEPVRWGRVIVDHGNGISSEYLHLDTITVAVGDTVTAGDQVGTSGGRGDNKKTGKKGPKAYDEHLHLGIIDTNVDKTTVDQWGHQGVIAEKFVNPLCYLADKEILKYDISKNLGCTEYGGAYKFCEQYSKDTGITVIKEEYVASASTEAMLSSIDAHYGKMIESAVAGTTVPKAMVIAVIAQESSGDPTIINKESGAAGLMQFTQRTAKEYGLSLEDRFVPEKAIPAGVQLLQDYTKSFSTYNDQVAFGLAAYNAGPGFIKKAIQKTGKSDPSWEEVKAEITEDLVAEIYRKEFGSKTYEKNFGTTEKRNAKVGEVRNYPAPIMNYYYAYLNIKKEKKEV
jgi:murein DD-endopeptidase MepM/ murein hydrolase activator NlpD